MGGDDNPALGPDQGRKGAGFAQHRNGSQGAVGLTFQPDRHQVGAPGGGVQVALQDGAANGPGQINGCPFTILGQAEVQAGEPGQHRANQQGEGRRRRNGMARQAENRLVAVGGDDYRLARFDGHAVHQNARVGQPAQNPFAEIADAHRTAPGE